MTGNRNALEVFVNDASVGILARDDEGFFDFRYHDQTHPDHAVSLGMPITEDPDEYVEFGLLPASFQVSLPEGVVMERLRSLYKKDFNMDDPFDLLRLVGRNGIGRVTYGGKRSLAPVQVRDAILRDARSVSAAQRLWNDLDRLGPEAFGVSGAMPKILLDAKSTSAEDRPATLVLPSHIVKFDDAQHYGASLLEYACMSVCQRLGFRIPGLELSPSGDALIIQRFDRTDDGRYLGFEDACALSGYQRNQKYQGSVEELFDMAKTFIPESRWEEAIRDLTRMVLVNDILRNGDAHLKNFALLYDHPDDAYWSPVYDVLNTTMFYPDDRPALSWDVDRKVDQVWLDDSRALDVLCRLSGQEASRIKRDYKKIGDDIRASMDDIVQSMKDVPLEHDRRSFVNGLPQYFDAIFDRNQLYHSGKPVFFTKEKHKNLEQAFHNGTLPQPGEGMVTGTVRALVKDANANAFALVEVLQTAEADGQTFAVPVSDADRGSLVIGETATFQAVAGLRRCELVSRTDVCATQDSGAAPWKKTDCEP
ncbi:type II toxin-antitoxin system HipA family toxin [Acidithiobacillus sp.]